MSKRVLVTGATGFIGSHIVRRLINDGHNVAILVRSGSKLERIADIASAAKVLTADITDPVALRAQVANFAPQWVFHMANAGLYGGVSLTDAEVARVNLIGLINLLECLEEVPYEAFINGGSSAEYGAKQQPMKETDYCEPLTSYAVTKLAATNYASMYAKVHKKPVITFRIFSPFGPFDDERRLISTVIRSMLLKKPMTVVPGVVRDYLAVEEFVAVFLEAAQALATRMDLGGQVFNIGSGKQRTARQVIETIAEIMKVSPEITWSDAAARSWESPMWQADLAKTFQHFSWRPRISFEEEISKTVEWARTQY
jgi:nucleoside-diphosphate-sugar epimerase